MKRILLCATLTALVGQAAAQSTVSISGHVKVAVQKSNSGTSPGGGVNPTEGGSMNDLFSALIFSGKEDLGQGNYAGFELASFVSVDSGAASTPFWARRSVIKYGGDFGEFYAGRSLTPAHLMLLLADPWYWDGSIAMVGWDMQQANYTATSYLRTNNTLGYVSPKVAGFTFSAAAAPGEGTNSRDFGGSVTYDNGPLWLGVAYDRSRGFFNDPQDNNMKAFTAAYDFGIVRPVVSFTASSRNNVSYKAYSLAATAPVGSKGLLKAQFSQLNDFLDATAQREKLARVGLGYQHTLSKRTHLFANLSRSKGDTRTTTNTFELGMQHGF